ncbi:anthrone oxygenase family protein [Salinarimonas chemoclinalis]|uniref:anthrone oxygenase family protein n=1 Tax=Salinarimonas chemoclinalis TaxID=3241599 RepID=UPI003556C8A6
MLTTTCSLWFALMAGFFFAFAAVVMPGLDRLPPAEAAVAMQAVNAAVANPLFALGFWGAVGLAVVALPTALLGRAPGWSWLLAAAGCYLAGVLAVTAAGNVPLNRELAVIAGPEALRAAWPGYAADWGRLNGLRTIAALTAAALALRALGPSGAGRDRQDRPGQAGRPQSP